MAERFAEAARLDHVALQRVGLAPAYAGLHARARPQLRLCTQPVPRPVALASPASAAALRIAATSPGSLATRSRSTKSFIGFQRHGLPACAKRSASSTDSAWAS